MDTNSFEERLKTLINAKTPIIQIISHERLRIHASLIAASKGRAVFMWSFSEGLLKFDEKAKRKVEDEELTDPAAILEWFCNPERDAAVLLLEDFHPFISRENPKIISRLREISTKISLGAFKNRTLILSQPYQYIPPELEKDIQILEMPLPDRGEIKEIMRKVRNDFDIDKSDYSESLRLIDSALGLSSSEAMYAFACAAVSKHRLTENEIPLIVSEKEQVIRKSGHLEFFQPNSNLEDIGGLDRLKDWLRRREKAFTPAAKEYGLESPRGILLLGLPGTGKSLAAKAVANTWELPLLRLDMGKIFGGVVGESESNMRSSLLTAETLAPCILWIDEIEKGMSGLQSSGQTDGGTTSRVIGTFLTWMQEKKKPVFVVATANNISQIPPELLRKGRVDEIFFVDLPDELDRKEIIEIHLKKRKNEFESSELEKIAKESRGFTGAELEEAIKEAMYRSFDDERELTSEDVLVAISETTPLSVTMSEIIRDTREWAKGRAVRASSRPPEAMGTRQKPSVKLKAEDEMNPFIKEDQSGE